MRFSGSKSGTAFESVKRMATPKQRLAFWLVPAPREAAFFAKIIEELATRFDAPVFEPHLTLHGGNVDPLRATDALREIPAASNYQLEIEGIHASGEYIKTLFVRFRPSGELHRLRAALGEILDLESGAEFDPHLSLLYKEMPASEKASLAENVLIPFELTTFAGLKLIAHPPAVETRADVEAWHSLGERPLAKNG